NFQLRPGLQINQQLSAAAANVPAPATDPTFAAYAATGAPVFDIVSFQTPSDSGGGSPQNTYSMVHRVDFNLTDKTTLYGRYALLNQNEFAGNINTSPYVGFDTGQTQRNQNALFSLTHIWGPHVVSDTKVNFNRLNLAQGLNPQQPVQPSLYFNVNFLETV